MGFFNDKEGKPKSIKDFFKRGIKLQYTFKWKPKPNKNKKKK